MRLDYRKGILFVIAAISAHYIDSILNVFDPVLKKIVSLPIIDLTLLSIAVIGCIIIILDVLSYLRTRQELRNIKSEEYNTKKVTTLRQISKRKKVDDKLDDLLQEIESFNRKWKESKFLKTCYRRDIEMKTMWGNRGKIRQHSKEIRKRIKPLKRLQRTDILFILDALEKIIDRMIDLGLEIEAMFESTITIEQSLKLEPNKINRLLAEGDNIANDLRDIISNLEKSRRDLP